MPTTLRCASTLCINSPAQHSNSTSTAHRQQQRSTGGSGPSFAVPHTHFGCSHSHSHSHTYAHTHSHDNLLGRPPASSRPLPLARSNHADQSHGQGWLATSTTATTRAATHAATRAATTRAARNHCRARAARPAHVHQGPQHDLRLAWAAGVVCPGRTHCR